MTEEDRKLLLKDLSARVPYGVKFLRESWNYEWDQELSVIEVLEDIDKDGYINNTKVYNVEDIKPYLLPISSMTEEQSKELDQAIELELKAIGGEIDHEQATAFEVDFYNKHHFDWRGLISIGLALDATDKNIY